jgi:hypothetical protein
MVSRGSGETASADVAQVSDDDTMTPPWATSDRKQKTDVGNADPKDIQAFLDRARGSSSSDRKQNASAPTSGAEVPPWFARDPEPTAEAPMDPKSVQDFLDHVHGFSYRYKDPTMPGTRPGRQFGVMAQDMEKTPLGASFVHEAPHGKMVDYGAAAPTMMAALAMLNEKAHMHEALIRELAAKRDAA